MKFTEPASYARRLLWARPPDMNVVFQPFLDEIILDMTETLEEKTTVEIPLQLIANINKN